MCQYLTKVTLGHLPEKLEEAINQIQIKMYQIFIVEKGVVIKIIYSGLDVFIYHCLAFWLCFCIYWRCIISVTRIFSLT